MCLIYILYFVFKTILSVDISKSEIIFVAHGVNVTVNCPYKSNDTFQWKGPPNETLYSDKGMVNFGVNGIGITGDNEDGEYILIVYGFEESNEGRYQCSALIDKKPVTKNFNIWLKIRKPMIFITIHPSEPVIEGSNISFNCNGTSNPLPLWYRIWGPEGYISQTTYVTNITRTHVFTLFDIRRNATGNYTCTAENGVANGSATTWLNVLYSPKAQITGRNYSQTESLRSLVCEAKGNPITYSYKTWEHSYLDNHIRFLTGYDNGTLILPYINHTEKRYEDSGSYKCTVGNGVPDNDEKGDLYATAEIFIQTTGSPVFLRRNSKTHYGKYGESVNIQIHIYSTPQLTDVKLAKQMNDASIELRDEKEKITDTFHNKNVELLTYVVTFRISEINSEEYFTNYTIQAENEEGNCSFTFQLKDNACYCPEVPSLKSVLPGTKSVMINWTGGFDGGFPQSFVVEYKPENEEKWFDHTIKITEPNKNSYSAVIIDLLPHELYNFRMYAVNSMNRSQFSSVFKVTTYGDSSSSKFSVLPVYITIGLVLFLVTLASVGYLKYKSGNLKRRPEHSVNSNTGQEEGSVALNYIYGMNENQQPAVPGAAAASEIYSNFRSDEVLRTDGLACGPLTSQKKPLHQQPVKEELSELNYIEIELNHIPEGHKFYIHGQANKTEYSEIEFGVIGDPLPSSESEMDDDNDTYVIHCMVVKD